MDCCDFCVKVDDSKREVDPCTRMTRRCKGDTCQTCEPCPTFVRGEGFEPALNLARRRAAPSRSAKRKAPPHSKGG